MSYLGRVAARASSLSGATLHASSRDAASIPTMPSQSPLVLEDQRLNLVGFDGLLAAGPPSRLGDPAAPLDGSTEQSFEASFATAGTVPQRAVSRRDRVEPASLLSRPELGDRLPANAPLRSEPPAERPDPVRSAARRERLAPTPPEERSAFRTTPSTTDRVSLVSPLTTETQGSNRRPAPSPARDDRTSVPSEPAVPPRQASTPLPVANEHAPGARPIFSETVVPPPTPQRGSAGEKDATPQTHPPAVSDAPSALLRALARAEAWAASASSSERNEQPAVVERAAVDQPRTPERTVTNTEQPSAPSAAVPALLVPAPSARLATASVPRPADVPERIAEPERPVVTIGRIEVEVVPPPKAAPPSSFFARRATRAPRASSGFEARRRFGWRQG